MVFATIRRLHLLKNVGHKTTINEGVMLYNRIPKAASRTMASLLKKLGTLNGFYFEFTPHRNMSQRINDASEQVRLKTKPDLTASIQTQFPDETCEGNL